MHPLVDQLRQVFIQSQDVYGREIVVITARKRGDDIIGLHTLAPGNGDATRKQNFVQSLELRPQIVGHRATMGFVLRVKLLAKAQPRRVHHRHDTRCRMVSDQRLNGAHGAEQRIGRKALGRTHLGHSVKVTINHRGGIDQ